MTIKAPKEIEKDWKIYQSFRESGLKKQANDALLTVIEKIKSKESSYFKEFLFSLCEQGLRTDSKITIQYPIFVQCILPLLVEGVANNETKEIIYVVKANLSGFSREIYGAFGNISNRELLQKALSKEPQNIIIINLLVADYVEELYFGAHHLPDSLITDLKTAMSVIKESADLIIKNKSVIKIELLESHSYYSELYNDYSLWFNGNQVNDFSSWCESNNKKYSWVKSYYYY